jgi:integrase
VWGDFQSGSDGPVLVIRRSKSTAGVRSVAVVPSLARALTQRDRGYDATIIAKVLGHADPAFTQRTYIHTRDVPRFDDLDDVKPGASQA